MEPSHAAELLRNGAELEQRGERDGAEEAYAQADGLGSGEGASNLGLLLFERGALAEAEAALRRAEERGHPVGTFRLGFLLDQKGDMAEAVEMYRRAAERGCDWAVGNLATVLDRLGRKDDALTFLRSAAGSPHEAVATAARAALAARGAAVPGEAVTLLRAGSAAAERTGREGEPGLAAARYAELVVHAERQLGPGDGTTLALRHQVAHWTGESGDAEAAVALFERLLADRTHHQGERHPDTELARHQLAHWHGRAGRPREAARRYEELSQAAGDIEPSLEHLCDAGHWLQEAGDNAAALRTFTRMLQEAEQRLGPGHRLTGIARTRYAELAGGLPYGHAPGRESLQDLLDAAAAVEASGDVRRAGRMYGEIADRCERETGPASDETLKARVGQAQAAVKSNDFQDASVLFQRVLDCLELRGEGPGDARYDNLRVLRDRLAGMPSVPTTSVAKPQAEPQDEPGDRMAFNPGAEARAGWRTVKRAQAAGLAPDDPSSFGSYTVLECVGQGGFGRVYLCQDADGILVAVKTLHPEHASKPHIREGFAHEVAAARRVRERFTVPVIAADTSAATPWMAVPYVAAPSLAELIDQCGALDAATVRMLGAGIATALEAIHHAGIVHLDLKPGNVLLTEDGPRVIDFGIAQIERLTEPRRGFAGTLAYASPEQLHEHPRFTPASDVFSLGTVLARLVLGRLPWGSDGTSPAAHIRSGAPADLTGMPADLETIARRCLNHDPTKRPTPADVAAALAPTGVPETPPLPDRVMAVVQEHATRPDTTRNQRETRPDGATPPPS